jgi:CMP-N-acetylneuraminic acid synthetase
MLFQSTSVFRTKETTRTEITLFNQNANKAMFGDSPDPDNLFWSRRVEHGFLKLFLYDKRIQDRAQDLSPVFPINGCLYLIYLAESFCSILGLKVVKRLAESLQESLDINDHCKLSRFFLDECL